MLKESSDYLIKQTEYLKIVPFPPNIMVKKEKFLTALMPPFGYSYKKSKFLKIKGKLYGWLNPVTNKWGFLVLFFLLFCLKLSIIQNIFKRQVINLFPQISILK